MLKHLSKYRYSYLLLIGFVLYLSVVYHAWFYDFGILSHGDWNYYFNETMSTVRSQYFSLWLSDTAFGRVLIDVGQAPTYAAYGFLTNVLHTNYAINERLIHMWPVAILAPLGMYFLIKYIFQNKTAAIISAVFFPLSTYMLTLQTGHLTLAAAFAVSPIAILMFFKMMELKKVGYAVAAALALSLCVAYEPRAAYIVIFILLCYFIYELVFEIIQLPDMKSRINLLKSIAIVCIMFAISFIGLNLYWVVALAVGGSASVNEVTGRGLFGNSFYDLSHALALYFPFWTQGPPTPFTVQSIPLLFWLIPFFIVAGIILGKNNRKVLFFGFIAFIGILLSKQTAAPFTELYSWLYANLPGFNAFREASKFYYLIAISYSILIGSYVTYVLKLSKKSKYKVILIALALLPISIPVYNSIPLVTGNIGTLFKPRSMPESYSEITKILKEDKSYSRTYWVPVSTRWAYSDVNHPYIHGSSIAENLWNSKYTNNSSIKSNSTLNIFKQNFTNEILDSASIKYVIVPPRENNDDEDLFEHHGFDRNVFVDFLNSQPYLTKLTGINENIDVYINSEYKPYINAETNLIHLPKNTNENNAYNFVNNIDQNFNYTNDLGSQNASNLTSPFDIIKKKNFNNSAIELPELQVGKLYRNINHKDLSVSLEDNFVSLYDNSNLQVSSSNSILDSIEPKKISEVPVDLSSNISISIGKNLYELNDKDRNIGNTTDDIGIYQMQDDNNLIKNSSFEDKLWGEKVIDCNKYNNYNPEISMSRTTEQHTEGDYSLKLTSNKHTACSKTIINNISDTTYKLSFQYKLFGGREFKYKLVFNDEMNTEIKESVEVNTRLWTGAAKLISVPAGATSAELTLELLPDDRNQSEAIGYFDNFIFSKIKYQGGQAYTPEKYIQISDKNVSNLSIIDKKLMGGNLIQNPSFEQGSWQEEVGDCNAYDRSGDVKMDISTTGSSDGDNSLVLSSKKHTACISQAIDVKEGTSLLLDFEYKSSNASKSGYSINFNDPLNTNISADINIKNQNWNNYSKNFKVPFGATKMFLSIYGYESDSKNRYIDTHYDNFSLREVPNIDALYYVFSNSTIDEKNPNSIEYQQNSINMKTIQVHGAKKKFYLNMSENYHEGWKLYPKSKNTDILTAFLPNKVPNTVGLSEHYKLNNFLNSWEIDPEKVCENEDSSCIRNSDGTYDIELVIEFVPNRWFRIGLIISSITLIITAAYLARRLIKGMS